MVTNGLQRNVHSAGVLIAVVAQRFSPGEPLASAMRKSRRQGKRVTAPGCPPLVISGPARNQVPAVRSSSLVSSGSEVYGARL